LNTIKAKDAFVPQFEYKIGLVKFIFCHVTDSDLPLSSLMCGRTFERISEIRTDYLEMKNINKVKAFAVAVVLAMVVSVSFAMAQSTGEKSGDKLGRRGGGHHFAGREGRGGFGRMFKNLDLTDDQKAKFKQIRESHSATMKSLHEQIRTEMQGLHQANQGSSFDEALVSQKLAQIAPLRAKLMAEEFKMHQETLSVLTPEQKTKLEQSRAEFKAKRSEFKAKRGERKAPKS
jgi:periplasmic protein CpxP/Spy